MDTPDPLPNTRSATEFNWHRRREWLIAAAAWVAGAPAAWAQGRGQMVSSRGDVLVNGKRLVAGQAITADDRIETGPGSTATVAVGNSAFHLRANTRMAMERGSSPLVVGTLRLLTGGVASAWGKGHERTVVTPTLTAGIRGTGVYLEVLPEQDDRSYLCNCYGTVALDVGGEQVVSTTGYHQAFWGEPYPRSGQPRLRSAGAFNHTDEEMEVLAALAGERTAWQVAGRKGTKDGQGRDY